MSRYPYPATPDKHTCPRCGEPFTIYEKDNGLCWDCIADLACEGKVAAAILNEQVTPVCQDRDGPGEA